MWMDEEEEQRRLEIARAKYSQEEQKDLLREYVELRLLLENPFATMKVYVLEPLCEYCRCGRMPMEDGDSFVSTSRPTRPPRENCYMYPDRDGGNFYAADHGIVLHGTDGHEISCTRCQEDLSDETMLYVTEGSFQNYFCLEDRANGVPKWLRRHILDCYGRECFACGTPLTATTCRSTISFRAPRAAIIDRRTCRPCAVAVITPIKRIQTRRSRISSSTSLRVQRRATLFPA